MATNKQRSRETEDAILRAAMKLALEQGVSAVSIRDICREARVSIGSFYHHFSSKQQLVNRSFQVFDDELMKNINLSDHSSALDALTEVLLYQTEFVATHGGRAVTDYYSAILNDSQYLASNPSREYYRVVYRMVEQAFSQGYHADGRSVRQTAELLIQFVRGCLVDWCLHNQAYDVVEQTKDGLRVLLRGLFARSEEPGDGSPAR